MRERLYRAVNATNLSWDPDEEKDIDILTAMGLTDMIGKVNMLGGLLYALKGAAVTRSQFYFPGSDRYLQDQRNAAATLSDVARNHRSVRALRRPMRDSLATLAITEWLHENCPKCGGAEEALSGNGVMIQCSVCHGSGKRRFSNYERIATVYEWQILAFDQHPHRGKEPKAVRRRKRDALLERLERDYLRHCDRPLYVMHGLLGLAQKDKAATVWQWLGRGGQEVRC